MPTQTLRTDRLILRAITAGDQAALTALWHDPDVRRYLWDDQLVTDAQVQEILRASEACFRDFGVGLYGLHLAACPEELVGFCGFRAFDQAATLELLYGTYPAYWGRGLVSEAAHRLLVQGFDQPACERVIAATDTPNQASVQVMRRLGMNFVERKRWRGLDTVFYALERHELGQS
jgi:RimJ/RimL family protein N-acetyltransferase